jgi:hypothetical protein
MRKLLIFIGFVGQEIFFYEMIKIEIEQGFDNDLKYMFVVLSRIVYRKSVTIN